MFIDFQKYLDFCKELWKKELIPSHFLIPQIFFDVEFEIDLDTKQKKEASDYIRKHAQLMNFINRRLWNRVYLESGHLSAFLNHVKFHFLRYKTYKTEFRRIYFRKEFAQAGVLTEKVGGKVYSLKEILHLLSNGEAVEVEKGAEIKGLEVALGFSDTIKTKKIYTGLLAHKFTAITSSKYDWFVKMLSYSGSLQNIPNPIVEAKKTMEVSLITNKQECRMIVTFEKIPKQKNYRFKIEDDEQFKKMFSMISYGANIYGVPIDMDVDCFEVIVHGPVKKNPSVINLFKNHIETVSDKIEKIVIVGDKGIGKSTLISEISKKNSEAFVEDSDDFGKFLSHLYRKYGAKMLEIEAMDVANESYIFFKEGLRDQYKSMFNVGVELYRAQQRGKKSLNSMISDIAELYRSMLNYKDANPRFYEYGLYKFLKEGNYKKHIQFCHVISDNYSRLGYKMCAQIKANINSLINVVARGIKNELAIEEIGADLILSLMYKSISQPTGILLDFHDILEIFGITILVPELCEIA